MDFLDILREKAFLGREFLTWLWFKSHEGGGRIELSASSVVEVTFLDKMVLDLADADSPQTVTLKGELSELREGLAALREGKKIEEARCLIKSTINEYKMVLKATWFSFGSLQTPPILPSGEEDPDESGEGAFLEKMYLLEEAIESVDSLFRHFLKLRLSDDWEARELVEIRKWIASGADSAYE